METEICNKLISEQEKNSKKKKTKNNIIKIKHAYINHSQHSLPINTITRSQGYKTQTNLFPATDPGQGRFFPDLPATNILQTH